MTIFYSNQAQWKEYQFMKNKQKKKKSRREYFYTIINV